MDFFGAFPPFASQHFSFFLIFYSGDLEVIDSILLLISIYKMYFIWTQINSSELIIIHCHHQSMNDPSLFSFLNLFLLINSPSKKRYDEDSSKPRTKILSIIYVYLYIFLFTHLTALLPPYVQVAFSLHMCISRFLLFIRTSLILHQGPP